MLGYCNQKSWQTDFCGFGEMIEPLALEHREWARLTMAAQARMSELLASRGLLSQGVIPAQTKLLIKAMEILASR